MVEINDKVHGPLEVGGASWRYVEFAETTVGLKELEAMGAIVTEVKEPLKWQGVIDDYNLTPYVTEEIQAALQNGKRFHAKLTEIVEGE